MDNLCLVCGQEAARDHLLLCERCMPYDKQVFDIEGECYRCHAQTLSWKGLCPSCRRIQLEQHELACDFWADVDAVYA